MAETVYDINGNSTGHTEDAAAIASAQDAVSKAADLKSKFAAALNVGTWEGLTSTPQEIIAKRTPDQIVDAFAKVNEQWKEPLAIIKNDEELKNALHGALAKDPTMLDGLTRMASETGGSASEFAASLKDPTVKKALTLTLNKIAEKPDDGHNFADFEELYKARNDKSKALAKMKEMGINPTDMVSGDQIFSMLRQALMSPTGFQDLFAKLPEMMGLTGEQARAVGELSNVFGAYMDLCLGTQTEGLRSLAVKYGDSAVAGVTDFGQRISGERDKQTTEQLKRAGYTDEEIKKQLEVAATGEHVDRDSGISSKIAKALTNDSDSSSVLKAEFKAGTDGKPVATYTVSDADMEKLRENDRQMNDTLKARAFEHN